MEVNKIVIESENHQVVSTPIDLTEDTATENTVLEGYTFHKANGVRAVGTATGGSNGKFNDLVDGSITTLTTSDLRDITTIRQRAFSDCYFLTEAIIPANITSIETFS